MVVTPFLPDGASEQPGCAQDLVPHIGAKARLLPQFGIPPGWDNGLGMALIVTLNRFCRRLTVLKSGTCQSNPASFSRLCAIPMARRSARLNRHLIVRQNWMAASLNFGLRPRLPFARPCQCISLSSQISSEPRDFNAVLHSFQFVVRYLGEASIDQRFPNASMRPDVHLIRYSLNFFQINHSIFSEGFLYTRADVMPIISTRFYF